MEDRAYYEIEPEPKKRRVLLWVGIGIGAILIVFGISSCAMMFGRLFEHASDRQAATKDFAETYFPDGLPPVSSGLYHPQAGVTDKALIEVDKLVRAAGAPTSIGEPTCTATTKASTNEIENGTLAYCTLAISYEKTPGRIEMTWKLEDGDWKVLRFYTHYDIHPIPQPEESPAPEE